jgi:hypothetical protein
MGAMRALLLVPLLLACGGPAANTSPQGDPANAWVPPKRKTPAPWSYVDCEKCGHGATPDIVRSEPEPEKVLDAVDAAPTVYKVVLENDQVRVLSATYQPGTKVPMHRHPDHVVFALTDKQVTALAFERAGMDEIEVTRPTASRALVVELGAKAGSPRPAGDEPVATYPRIFKLLLDEARIRVVRVKLGKGKSRPVALGDHVLLARDKGTLVVTAAGGEPRSFDLEPGKVEFLPAGVYTAINAKKESFEVVLFELKP